MKKRHPSKDKDPVKWPKREPDSEPLPKPEGRDAKGRDADELDPCARRGYHGSDGDAVDPQRTGPGT